MDKILNKFITVHSHIFFTKNKRKKKKMEEEEEHLKKVRSIL